MPIPKATVIAGLAFLYSAPGFLFLGLASNASSAAEPGRAVHGHSAVLTSPDEPGEPLLVSGTVYAADGETPVAGAEVYVYHTDAQGVYSETNDNTNPRIHATLKTDSEGRYEFRTIRPAPYPGGGPPAHIHYRVSAGDRPKQRFDLHFEGDPRISERMQARSEREGKFGSIRPLERDEDGVWRCVYDLRLGGS